MGASIPPSPRVWTTRCWRWPRAPTGSTSAAASCSATRPSADGCSRWTARPASSSTPSTRASTGRWRTSRSPGTRCSSRGASAESRARAANRSPPSPTTGALDPSFDAPPDGPVDALLVSFGRLYAGGAFQQIGDRSRSGLAAFDIATGELDRAFSPSTDGNVFGLTTDGTRPVPVTTDLGVAVDLAGRPVLRGQALAVDQRRSSVVVARLRRDGAFDCSFGSAGQARAFPSGLGQDPSEGGAIALVAGDDVLVAGARLMGRRAAAFVARFRGGAGTRPPAGPPAVTTGGLVFSLGRGTMGISGLVDPRCSTTLWAIEYGERSLTRRTPWRTIPAAAGPQDLCARLTGRPGRRYRARLVARSRGGRASGAVRAFTAKRGADASRCIA